MSHPPAAYRPVREPESRFVAARGLSLHLNVWGDESLVAADRPPLLMLHGWMDVGASFQFVVDALAAIEGASRFVIAPDWRGFGLSDSPPADGYWFPDYLGDLEALLDRLAPGQPVDLLGHSMGGNVAMLYAGVRPPRIRRLVNLEGFGMPAAEPGQAPSRYAKWLDELRTPQRLMSYADPAGVAARLQANNPRLPAERADWLATRWAKQTDDGRWHILADPDHKRVYPVLYRREEAMACWARISAPLLWAEGAATDMTRWWGSRYPREDFEQRLAEVAQVQRVVIPDAGHMLHHDQPAAVAAALAAFLRSPPQP